MFSMLSRVVMDFALLFMKIKSSEDKITYPLI